MSITKLAAVLNGLVKNTDLTTQEIVVDSVKVGGSSGTALTKTVLDGLVSNSHASGSDNQTITAGSGLSGGGSGSTVTLDVSVDNSSIEISSDALRVKAGGITNDMLAGSIAANKLAQTYIQTSEKGANSSVATLDSGGKVPVSQLPNSVMEYQGTWAASTNTPTLADGTGNAGDVYIASDAGTVNFGSGNITFAAGDWVMYSGSVWQKSINSNAVASVNGQTGAVTLDTDDISEGTTNKYYTATQARTDLIAASISDGDTTHAPSGNAVYDALALKADDSSSVKSVNSVLPVSGDVSIDTDDIDEGATNKYYSPTLFDNSFATKTTDQLTEGTSNKYYSSGLFSTDFAAKNTDDLDEGVTNKYYSTTLFNTDFGTTWATKDTDDLTEGATNKYYSSTLFNSDFATAWGTKTSDDLTEGTTNKFLTAAEETKLGFISVSQAVDLDDMESDISTLQGDVSTLQGASHTHTNQTVLDNTTASFVTADETKLDFISVSQAVDLDSMESSITSLQTDSHTHNNKSILDNTTASFLTADETKLDFITVTQAVSLDTLDSNVNDLIDGGQYLKFDSFAGETFEANKTFLVRMALTGETAGRVFKATNASASTDGKFWVIGIVQTTSEVSAGTAIKVYTYGMFTLKSADTAFDSADIGKPVWLTTAGGFSITAPSASDTACYKVGIVRSTTIMLITDKQLTVIN